MNEHRRIQEHAGQSSMPDPGADAASPRCNSHFDIDDAEGNKSAPLDSQSPRSSGPGRGGEHLGFRVPDE